MHAASANFAVVAVAVAITSDCGPSTASADTWHRDLCAATVVVGSIRLSIMGNDHADGNSSTQYAVVVRLTLTHEHTQSGFG